MKPGDWVLIEADHMDTSIRGLPPFFPGVVERERNHPDTGKVVDIRIPFFVRDEEHSWWPEVWWFYVGQVKQVINAD